MMNQTTSCETCNCPVRNGLVTVLAAALALVLFIANTVMVLDAQETQRDFGKRQAQINDGMQLDQLNRQLIQALGAAQVQNKDKKIEALLGQHGITISTEPQKQ